MISEILKENGYATSLIGKWHLGHQPEYHPLKHGFDEWYGAPNCHFGPYDDKYTPNVPFYRNETMIGRYYEDIEINRSKYLSNITIDLTNEAIDFIKRKKSQNFFLYFAPDATHAPVYSSPNFRKKSKRGPYGDAVMELDWAVGQIYSTLEENDILDETIIIFSSDNGAACVGSLDQSGSNGPLLCCKQTTMDGGMRVPGIFHWHDHFPPKISHQVGTLMDIYPTILDIINIPFPKSVTLDGVSLFPVLKPDPKPEIERAHFFYRGDTLAAVRAAQYKMHVYTRSGPLNGVSAGITKWHFCRGSYVANLTTTTQTDHSSQPLIFNMDKDPSETLPLPFTSPEYIEARARLEKIIKNHEATLIKGKPELNMCDPKVMNWAPPGCEAIDKCLPIPKSNLTECYWDH